MELSHVDLKTLLLRFPLNPRREYPRWAFYQFATFDHQRLPALIEQFDHLLSKLYTHVGKSWNSGEYAETHLYIGQGFNRTYPVSEFLSTLTFVESRETTLKKEDLYFFDLKELTKFCIEHSVKQNCLGVKISCALKAIAEAKANAERLQAEQLEEKKRQREEQRQRAIEEARAAEAAAKAAAEDLAALTEKNLEERKREEEEKKEAEKKRAAEAAAAAERAAAAKAAADAAAAEIAAGEEEDGEAAKAARDKAAADARRESESRKADNGESRNMASFACLSSIDTFSGDLDTLDVRDWIQQIDHAGVLASWDPSQHCQVAKLKMRGAARDFLSTNPDLPLMRDWEEFKKHIFARFHVQETTMMLTQKLTSATQQRGESARAFASRLQRIANRLNESRGPPKNNAERDLRRSIINADVCAQFLKGLSPNIRSLVRVQAKKGVELQDLISIATLEEQAQENGTGETSGGQLAAMYADKPVSNAAREKEKRKCFFCQKQGHLIKDCRKKKREYDAQRLSNMDYPARSDRRSSSPRYQQRDNSPRRVNFSDNQGGGFRKQSGNGQRTSGMPSRRSPSPYQRR